MALYAFDGTWNTEKRTETKTEHNTNVVKFRDLYETGSGKKQYYVEGVGTRWDWVGKIFGGAFGFGELPRLEEAYDALCKRWAEATTDEDRAIDIIGFSRGAATALDFCGLVQDRGVCKPGSNEVVAKAPTIRFLGLWDVVDSFGFAFLGDQALNFFHDLGIPKSNIDYCFHAMALDERRPSFLNTRLTGAYEVWFRGVHSDIGGGNGNTGLSDITLRWMLEKARAAGLPIDAATIPTWTPPVKAVPQPVLDLPLEIRQIGSVDRCHYSVSRLDPWCNPPSTCVPETAAEEGVATKAGDINVATLSQDDRRKVVALAETAKRVAKMLEVTLEPATCDHLMQVFINRLPLIKTDHDLNLAAHATVDLLSRAVQNAKHAFFPTIEPVFLLQAISQPPPLPPLTD
jgi:hypothetical protein